MTWQLDFRNHTYRLLGTEYGVRKQGRAWAMSRGPYLFGYLDTLREAKKTLEQLDLQEQLDQRLRDEGSHRGDAPLSAR